MAERKFFTASVELVRDPRPSALDFRVYACVSLHDGMSLLKGKGAGCFASNQTLAAKIGCDYTSLSKSLNRLVEWGYITKERQADDKRCTTYRCVFDFPDSWRDGQLTGGAVVGETANHRFKVVGLEPAQTAEIVGRAISETHGNLRETATHYIPLKGELDSVETGELDSPKVRVADAPRCAPKASAMFRSVEPTCETLAKFERQWKQDWTVFDANLSEWRDWLYQRAEDEAGEDNVASNWAQRLAEQVDDFIGYVAWERGGGEL